VLAERGSVGESLGGTTEGNVDAIVVPLAMKIVFWMRKLIPIPGQQPIRSVHSPSLKVVRFELPLPD
jgi:hypothetical protein